ncbi:MAG: hypothetical protein ACI9E1_001774 [Cryomorphaceae bacterium]|jgi:hypothetical protein
MNGPPFGGVIFLYAVLLGVGLAIFRGRYETLQDLFELGCFLSEGFI